MKSKLLKLSIIVAFFSIVVISNNNVSAQSLPPCFRIVDDSAAMDVNCHTTNSCSLTPPECNLPHCGATDISLTCDSCCITQIDFTQDSIGPAGLSCFLACGSGTASKLTCDGNTETFTSLGTWCSSSDPIRTYTVCADRSCIVNVWVTWSCKGGNNGSQRFAVHVGP